MSSWLNIEQHLSKPMWLLEVVFFCCSDAKLKHKDALLCSQCIQGSGLHMPLCLFTNTSILLPSSQRVCHLRLHGASASATGREVHQRSPLNLHTSFKPVWTASVLSQQDLFFSKTKVWWKSSGNSTMVSFFSKFLSQNDYLLKIGMSLTFFFHSLAAKQNKLPFPL